MGDNIPGSTGGSNSNESRGRSVSDDRKTVIVKGLYGTRQYPPDTDCEVCSRLADGVLVIEKTRTGSRADTGMEKPLCDGHKDQIKKDNAATWDNAEWRPFEEE